ncbi:MAG: terminase family protein [Bryobacteraceae bacterium]
MRADCFLEAVNPAVFATNRLGFSPDPHQTRVLNATTTRGLLNCCRQWGKSTSTAAKAIHHAFFHPRATILVLCPSARQSAEFLRKRSHFLEMIGIRPRGDGDNEISLLLPNQSRIIGLPGNETTIRGFSAVSLLLIDEASRVPDALYLALRPTLATSPGAAIWLMSTPNGKRGFFYDTWVGAAHFDENTPPDNWSRITVQATDCPRIAASFLDEERATLGDLWFRQEYLCEFVEDEQSLFRQDDLLALLSDDIEPLFPVKTGRAY